MGSCWLELPMRVVLIIKSVLRLGFAISVDSGKVLDYIAKCKDRFVCKARNQWDKYRDCQKKIKKRVTSEMIYRLLMARIDLLK